MMQFAMCIPIPLLFILLACGKQHFPDYQEHSDVQFEETREGYFTARFNSLNPQRAGRIKAQAILWIRGDQLYVGIKMDQGMPRVRYQQFIHLGSSCPDQLDDENADGRLDEREALANAGERLLSLDGSLRSQGDGSGWFPIANSKGTYFYSRSASVQLLMADLRAPDMDPDDGHGKLGKNEDLNLNQRTILLYGSASDPLLPVACAQINEDIIPEN